MPILGVLPGPLSGKSFLARMRGTAPAMLRSAPKPQLAAATSGAGVDTI